MAHTEQLSFGFDEPFAAAAGVQLGVQNGAAIPRMSELEATPVRRPRKAAAPAVPAVPEKESRKEAARLVAEGLLIRYASLQRRYKLQGSVHFGPDMKDIAPVRSFDELVPKFLRKLPEGWSVSEEGFVHVLARTDAAVISKLINADKDDLGVYSCERSSDGYRVVFEF